MRRALLLLPAALAVLAVLAMLVGCEREKRALRPPPSPGLAASGPATPYTAERQAWAVSQGKHLYRWYNCSGCHGPGGGGDWGPPLSDARWFYGSAPQDIYASIVQGRPNGMPAFGQRLPEDQVWQLVAYVRSLSGQLRKDVAPSRSDGLQGASPENERAQERPEPGAPPR